MTRNDHRVASPLRIYEGRGRTLEERALAIPAEPPWTSPTDPAGYLAGRELRAAVNVALRLGQPLLLTGEPGTGKTQLASSVAWELGLPAPLVFHTKTTSTASDLFYHYDSLGHFHASQFRQDEAPRAEDFIRFEALGQAVLLSLPVGVGDAHLPEALRGRGPVRSVVLVDEIDKAPRDLPNDLLHELDRMAFRVRETGQAFEADAALRPIVVVTSNSERSLPDAFLRRCVFFHIEFPDAERLREIVRRRLDGAALSPDRLDEAVQHFAEIRALALRKKPATAELLAWLRIVAEMDVDLSKRRPGDLEALAISYSVLAKSPEDLVRMRRALDARQGEIAD